MRFLSLALFCVAGCAVQPASPPASPATAPTSPVAAASQPQPTSAVSSESIQQRAAINAALKAGYSLRLRQGEQVYCREETPIGTRFRNLHCYTVAELADALRDQDTLHDLLARPLVCSGGSICVAN